MQFVRLVNADTRPYDFHHANRKRILNPGEEAMVPWDVATSLFGDPFTTDTPKEPARTRAFQQASGIHNYNTVEGAAKERGISAAEYWEQLRPKVQVYDVETGDRIYMVLEDQDGTKINGTPQAPMNEQLNQAFMAQQIADLQKTISALVQAQMLQAQTTLPTGQTETASQDGPPATGFDLPTTPAPADSAPLGDAVAGTDSPPVSTEDTPQAEPTGATSKLAGKVKA
jgi:hypothetical protein